MSAGRSGVVLDRDGTLIDVVRDEETGSVHVAFHPDQLTLLPGVVSGLTALSKAGFVLAVATNQPGPAKGQISRDAVQRTNEALLRLLASHAIAIAALEVCLHHPTGHPRGDAALVRDCDCRKPKAGMLTALVNGLGLDARQSWMIGDSAADVEAAHTAGLRSALVFSQSRCELCPLRQGPLVRPELVAPRFDELVAQLLAAGPA